MKFTPLAVILFLLCGMLSLSLVDASLAKMLHRMRCKNNWDCKRCYEVKRQGRCHSGYLMGVCYKTCTGCDRYKDSPKYNCSLIYKRGKCFGRMIYNPYINYAQRCEASCCQAYPMEIPPTTPSKTSPPTKPTTASQPKVIWNQWSTWSACSKTCHIGYRKRIRTCSSSRDPRVNCSRPQSQYRYCNYNVSCAVPVSGGFSEWSKWSSCPVTCGSLGKQSRSRTCTNPPPQNGGQDCDGPASETRACGQWCCSVQGGWGEWSLWSSCSKTCRSPNDRSGTRKRTRSCTNPRPVCGAPPCKGPFQQTEACHPKMLCANPTKTPSPYWGNWGSWGPCSTTCYGGYRERQRECIGYPGYGKYCNGRLTQFESCNTYVNC